MARIFPQTVPLTTACPTHRVPFCTSNVAMTPLVRSNLPSITVPKVLPAGLAWISVSSATREIASNKSSSPSWVLAETGIIMASPPHSSGVRSSSANCCFTNSGLALGRSILFRATMMGIPAARAWSKASRVCGITPSSAATTSTAMSVERAPRARMAVNASWPGVSKKVMLCPSYSI